MMLNAYEFLEVTTKASDLEIKKAYLRMAKVMHPDAGGLPSDFIAAHKAYEILKDTQLRAHMGDAKIFRAPTSKMFGAMRTDLKNFIQNLELLEI